VEGELLVAGVVDTGMLGVDVECSKAESVAAQALKIIITNHLRRGFSDIVAARLEGFAGERRVVEECEGNSSKIVSVAIQPLFCQGTTYQQALKTVLKDEEMGIGLLFSLIDVPLVRSAITQGLRKSHGITYARVFYDQICLESGLGIKSATVHGRRVGFQRKLDRFT
jgi:hypothetical protein